MPGKDNSASTIQGLSITVLLAQNRMPIEDQAIKSTEAYQAVMEISQARISRERHSPEKAAKASDYELLAAEYKERNEQTFIEMFFLPLMQRVRNVEVINDKGINTDNPWWEERAWADDGLDINVSRPFLRQSLPKVDTKDNRNLKKLLESHERIKNPVPDRCYALSQKAFTTEENQINLLLHKYTGISAGIFNPSVIIEFGMSKPILELEGQCARGGAALVNAFRCVRSAADENIMAPGADQDSLIYSFAITGVAACLFVHWAYVDGTNTTFHMHIVEEYSLRRGVTIVEMRGALNNLQDWTVGDRKVQIKALLHKIAAKGNQVAVPSPIALESATEETENTERDENEQASEAAASLSVGTTPNKKRKEK